VIIDENSLEKNVDNFIQENKHRAIKEKIPPTSTKNKSKKHFKNAMH